MRRLIKLHLVQLCCISRRCAGWDCTTQYRSHRTSPQHVKVFVLTATITLMLLWSISPGWAARYEYDNLHHLVNTAYDNGSYDFYEYDEAQVQEKCEEIKGLK